MCQEDLEARHEVSQGNARVTTLPLLVQVDIINKDDKVILATLVVDLGLDGLAASHDEGSVGE